MQTISTHQTIGLTSTTYAVTTDDGRTIGTYQQDHGADTVTSPELPAEDDGVIGPIEAIAYFARVAGVRGYRLSEKGETAYAQDLTAEVQRRVQEAGGRKKITITDIYVWSKELGLTMGAAHIAGAIDPALTEPKAVAA